MAHGNSFKKKFLNKVETGLYANEDYTQFRYRFTMGGKEYSKTFHIKASFGLRDRKRLARREAEEYRDDLKETLFYPFNKNTKVDKIAEMYFDKKCDDSSWTSSTKKCYPKSYF